MAPLIPISTLHRVNSQLHGPVAFPRCNRPRHSFNRRMHGLQTRPGRLRFFLGGGTNLLPLLKIEQFVGSPAHYLVSVPITLFQRYRIFKIGRISC